MNIESFYRLPRVFLGVLAEAAPENAEALAPDCAETTPPTVDPPMATPERENMETTPIIEAAVPAETAPMPEPTRETIPTPVHDVKPPAPPIEEQRNQSATRGRPRKLCVRDAGGNPESSAEWSYRTAERAPGRRPATGRPAPRRRVRTPDFQNTIKSISGAKVEVVKRDELHTFVVLPKRWIVEGAFGWLDKCRRLWENCERLLRNSLQMISLAFVRLLLARYETGS